MQRGELLLNIVFNKSRLLTKVAENPQGVLGHSQLALVKIYFYKVRPSGGLMTIEPGSGTVLKISVGSTNPVKLEASVEAFELAGERVEVTKLDIQSGVSDQPTSDREAIKGAEQRAKKAKERGDFDFGVGLEGSVTDTDFGMFLTGWALLMDSKDSYLGGGGRLQLPGSIADRIRNGEELGPVMDEVTGRSGVKEGEGAIGIFTNGIISRKEAYRNALVFALAKYLNPEFYS